MLYNQLIRSRKFFPINDDLKNEFTRQWFANFLAYFALFSSLILAFFDFQAQRYIVFYIDLATTLCYVVCIIYFNKGYSTFPKFLLFFSGYFGIIATASILGRDSGLNNLWFPYICGIFILFNGKKIKLILLFLSFIAFAILFLELTDYQFLNKYAYPNIDFKIYTLFCYTISITILTMYILNLHQSNEKYKNKISFINKNLIKTNKNLRKVNEELDSFVYKASHDLRSPLTSLLGLIEIAKMEKDINKIETYLNFCEESVLKLDSFILDILNISKNERQKISIDLIDFKTLINEFLSQIKYLENTKKMKFNLKIDSISNFYSDYRRLHIVFNNIITNAILYSDSKKQLSILNINIELIGSEAIISFVDNGIGIKQEVLNNVFQMFYRGSHIGNGSGLGLYIVKETIDKLKGKIEISSEYDKWTHIKLTIPNLNPSK